jgi:hypothetical protein
MPISGQFQGLRSTGEKTPSRTRQEFLELPVTTEQTLLPVPESPASR